MYTAEYDDGTRSLWQAVLFFPLLVLEPSGNGSSWWEGLRYANDLLLASPSIEPAIRIQLRSGVLERILFLTTLQPGQEDLKVLARVYDRLNAIVPGSALLCENREVFDTQTEWLAPRLFRIRWEPYHEGNLALWPVFRLFPLLNRLFAIALERGTDMVYQAHFRRYMVRPEDLRQIKRNRVTLLERELPAALVKLQRKIPEKVEQSAFLLDEFLAVSLEEERTVTEYIQGCFDRDRGQHGFRDCSVFAEVSPSIHIEQVHCAFHSSFFSALTWEQVAGQAARRTHVEQILAWRAPSACLLTPPQNSNAAPKGTAEAPLTELEYLRRIEQKLEEMAQLLRQKRQLNALEDIEQVQRAIAIARADMPFALVKARAILEKIVKRIYDDHKKAGRLCAPASNPGRKLGKATLLLNMLEELEGVPNLFPRNVQTYLHSIRILGNLVAHDGMQQGSGSTDAFTPNPYDVQVSLLMILSVVEWYLTNYSSPTPSSP